MSFNAWHNEQESDPVAALYASIVDQGVPKLPSPEAIRFRLKLLWQRRTRGLAGMAVWPVLLALLAGYFLFNPERFDDSLGQLAWLVERGMAFIEGQSNPSASASGSGARWAPTIAALLGFAGVVRSLGGRLSAFGVDPGALLARITGKLQGSAQERVGFHARFAEDFRRVTAALAPRRMVVCVDDLDRCEPQNALRILEAVNFLVGSGDCFVVIAASRAIIEHDIELASANAAPGLETPDGKPADPKEYARLDLQKLINLEVPIPSLDLDQAARLLAQRASPAAGVEGPARDARLARADRLQRASSRARAIRRWAILGTMVALAAWAGAALGRSASAWRATGGVQPPKVAPAASPGAPGPAGAPVAKPEDWKATVAAYAPFRHPRFPREVPAHSGWTFALLGAALALVLIPLIRPPDVVVHDSDSFREALRAWSGVILQRHRTPRALKQFLNRLRFAAMRRRSQQPEAEDWLAVGLEGWSNGFATGGRLVHCFWWGCACAVASWRNRTQSPDAPVHEAWLVALMALPGEEGGPADGKPNSPPCSRRRFPPTSSKSSRKMPGTRTSSCRSWTRAPRTHRNSRLPWELRVPDARRSPRLAALGAPRRRRRVPRESRARRRRSDGSAARRTRERDGSADAGDHRGDCPPHAGRRERVLGTQFDRPLELGDALWAGPAPSQDRIAQVDTNMAARILHFDTSANGVVNNALGQIGDISGSASPSSTSR